MKRLIPSPSSRKSAQAAACSTRPRRRGTLFHQTMIYMTLASSLMTVGGLCLHSILRADTADRKVALFLSSLMRAESQLRDDSRLSLTGGARLESPEVLTCAVDDQTQVRWTSDRGILTRTKVLAETSRILETDRYIFPAGSRIEMSQDTADSVSIQIIEPSAFLNYASAAHGGTNLNKVAAGSTPALPLSVGQPNRVVIRLKGARP
jgi:hypothetical protein